VQQPLQGPDQLAEALQDRNDLAQTGGQAVQYGRYPRRPFSGQRGDLRSDPWTCGAEGETGFSQPLPDPHRQDTDEFGDQVPDKLSNHGDQEAHAGGDLSHGFAASGNSMKGVLMLASVAAVRIRRHSDPSGDVALNARMQVVTGMRDVAATLRHVCAYAAIWSGSPARASNASDSGRTCSISHPTPQDTS